MKKLFNYALLAAALLVGVNVNAQTYVAEVAGVQYETLDDAFSDALSLAAGGDEVTITSIAPANVPTAAITIANGEKIVWNVNGQNISMDKTNTQFGIKLNKGYLKITNGEAETPGHISFYGVYGDGGKDYDAGSVKNYQFLVMKAGNLDAVYTDYYTKFVLDKNVSISCENHAYGVAILHNGKVVVEKKNYYYANGSVAEIAGHIDATWGALSTNGNLSRLDPNGNVIPNEKVAHIHIKDGAELIGTTNEAAGIYAAGYAIWDIDAATIIGATGLYVKAGILDINGATITGNGEAVTPQAYGNGFESTGDGIVLDSHGSYAGGISVTVQGNTTISSDNGYGIQEVLTQGTEDKCEKINIVSGSISGEQGALVTTETAKDNTVIEGGTFSSDITEYLGDDNIVTPTIDDNGNTIYVIGTKDPDKDWKNDITTAEPGDYVKLEKDKDQTIGGEEEGEEVSIEAEYLITEDNAKVTISSGSTLTVGEIVMSKDAQIIVKPGATLIVKDDKGIVANQAQNIILQSEENKPAYLLLDPQVTSNKTPKATIKFYSDAFTGVHGDQQQLFGNPMAAVTSVKAFQVKDDAPAEDRIFFDLWKKNAWNYLGGINVDDPIDYSKFNEQFGLYCITSKNEQENKLYYVLEGNAVGNSQPESFKLNYGWTSAANSWTGDMDGGKLLEKLQALSNDAENLSVNVYLATVQGTVITWNGYGVATEGNFKVQPLQPMMFDNEEPKVITSDIMSYENLVWNPATKGGNQAPRQNANDIQKVNIRLTSEEGLTDRVVVASTKDYSDPRYSARKYMNDDICIYVNMDKKYDSYMAEDVNNALIGFNCAKAGQYTLSFEGVTGDFALIDLTNNARINMVEGATYEFLAEEGENANRFMVVEGAKAPTNNEKVNGAVKAMKVISGGEFRIVKENRAFNAMGAEL